MKRAFIEVLQTLALALVLFFILQASIENRQVLYASMEPTLSEGQRLVLNKLVYLRLDRERLEQFLPFLPLNGGGPVYPFHPPRRGEVIVFHSPQDSSRDFIKRIVGLPGETVEIVDGQVHINGQLLEEPYLAPGEYTSNMRPYRVPPDGYFVLGDNRGSSSDSRNWGAVPLESVVGKAWIVYWPPSRAKFLGESPALEAAGNP